MILEEKNEAIQDKRVPKKAFPKKKETKGKEKKIGWKSDFFNPQNDKYFVGPWSSMEKKSKEERHFLTARPLF